MFIDVTKYELSEYHNKNVIATRLHTVNRSNSHFVAKSVRA